jgi:hypothetical protein
VNSIGAKCGVYNAFNESYRLDSAYCSRCRSIRHCLQLRSRRERYVLGHSGRCATTRRYRQHSGDTNRSGANCGVQHFNQRFRRHSSPRANDAGAAIQRRGDARFWPALRWRGSLQDGSVDQFGRSPHIPFGLHQPHCELGPLAGYIHQYHEGAAQDQGRLRRPVRDGFVRPQLERDCENVQLLGRSGNADGR